VCVCVCVCVCEVYEHDAHRLQTLQQILKSQCCRYLLHKATMELTFENA
jgi:hypothetical protein